MSAKARAAISAPEETLAKQKAAEKK